jgi:hypothetical protein
MINYDIVNNPLFLEQMSSFLEDEPIRDPPHCHIKEFFSFKPNYLKDTDERNIIFLKKFYPCYYARIYYINFKVREYRINRLVKKFIIILKAKCVL